MIFIRATLRLSLTIGCNADAMMPIFDVSRGKALEFLSISCEKS
jgi:hypothetical protein